MCLFQGRAAAAEAEVQPGLLDLELEAHGIPFPPLAGGNRVAEHIQTEYLGSSEYQSSPDSFSDPLSLI